jgi:RNA exonuclease 1
LKNQHLTVDEFDISKRLDKEIGKKPVKYHNCDLPNMPEVELDDPLAKSTARLSISLAEGENPRLQVAELLREAGGNMRRDSAVSLTSLDEDLDIPPTFSTSQTITNSLSLKTEISTKRRRSSAQSIISSTKENKEKVHKKKIKKANQSVELQLHPPAGKPLAFKKLRDFVLSTYSNTEKENWYTLNNPSGVAQIVFCLVPGLPFEVVQGNETLVSLDQVEKKEGFDWINDNFKEVICSSCPGSKESIYLPLQTLTNIPLTKKEKKTIVEKLKANKITINDLLLNTEELSQNGYPMEVKEDWVETQDFEHEGSHIFALDCEFCQSAKGKELTRISLINFQGETVIDLLVKPSEVIIDYLTKYSGITGAKLQDVTTTLKDVQQEILRLVSSTDILIGHSLESDLNVMHIKHTRVVDTAIIYEHSRGPPLKPSLKWLALKYLVRNIQEGENNGDGHSSIEDAQACLDLVKMKICEGMCHGLNVNEVSIFQRLARTSRDAIKSLWINYTQYQEQESYHEPAENNVKHAYVKNDDEVVESFIANPDRKFTVLTLRELEFNLGWSNPPKHYTGLLEPEEFREPSQLQRLYKRTNDRLNKIYEQLPENSIIIIHSTVGSPLEMFRLQNLKRDFQKLQRDGQDITTVSLEDTWDFDKQQALILASNVARESVSFIKIKE